MRILDGFLRVAHRGASGQGLAPENTLAAFEMAIALGADAIECDVHATSDGAVVVMHDPKLDRTTNGKGPIAETTLEAIRRLDAGAWKAPKFAGQRVPTLREMLAMIGGRLISIIEIKASGIERAVVDDIVSTNSVGNVVVFSFAADAVRNVRALNPNIATALLVVGDSSVAPVPASELVKKVQSLGAQALAPNAGMVTAEMLQAIHAAGLKLWGWTVNDPEQMKKLHGMGVDAIITDRIDLLNEAIGAA